MLLGVAGELVVRVLSSDWAAENLRPKLAAARAGRPPAAAMENGEGALSRAAGIGDRHRRGGGREELGRATGRSQLDLDRDRRLPSYLNLI